jgi:hypothetical protein
LIGEESETISGEDDRPPNKRAKLGIENTEIWDSESEEETVESAFAKKFKRNTFVPVKEDPAQAFEDKSPPPSPFLNFSNSSHGKDNLPLSKLEILKQKLENELERISDESNDVSSPNDKRGDEKMSLSSLSPDDPANIKLPPNPPPLPPLPPEELGQIPYNLPPEYYAGYPHPSMQQYNPYMVPWNMAPEYQSQGFPPEYNNYQHQMGSTENGIQMEEEEEEEEEEKPLNVFEVAELVIASVYNELSNALKKDIRRRIIEADAFKRFHTWCQKREQHYKEARDKELMAEPDDRFRKQVVSFNKLPPFSLKKTDSSIQRPLGLGIRNAIPKLPSFRIRKARVPTPVTVDEDSRKSYDTEAERSSESEPQATKRSLRRLSFSSDETSTSSESSSVDESDEESLSSFRSDGEQEKKAAAQRKNLLLETESISENSYSDFDADDSAQSKLPREDEIKVEKETHISDKIRQDSRKEKSVVVSSKEIDGALGKELAGISESILQKEEISIKMEDVEDDANNTLLDHNYCRPVGDEDYENRINEVLPIIKQEKIHKEKTKKAPRQPMQKVFKYRDIGEKQKIMYEFFHTLDMEDLQYFKIAFEKACEDDTNTHSYWLNSTHWVDYPPVIPSPKKVCHPEATKIHETGSARTEGYYKLSSAEKAKNRRQWGTKAYEQDTKAGAVGAPTVGMANKTQLMLSREARSNQRRLLTALGSEVDSDLLKFNQLKFRKKSLRFGRSAIHDWGLFASEPIAADEMVIEYVGQMIRPVIADLRERQYEAVGIGSSYLFRIDLEMIIDATRCGNLSRFINHSCNVSVHNGFINFNFEIHCFFFHR